MIIFLTGLYLMIIFLTGLCLPPRINFFISFLAATELKMNPISTSDLLHIVRTDFNILPLEVPRIVPVFSSFRAILYIYLAMRIYFWARKSSIFKQLSTKYNKLHNIYRLIRRHHLSSHLWLCCKQSV